MPNTRLHFNALVNRRLVFLWKHYVAPRLVRSPQRPYDAKQFFESWFRASEASDAATISAQASPLQSAYHYNALENSIIECLAGRSLARPLNVLDIGSGAGHWIDFARRVLLPDAIVGLELSSVAAARLREKYADAPEVEIVEGDVAASTVSLERTFGLATAVGVMFHIVEDERWELALRNLARMLAPDGFLVVTGQFGLTTQNVQFHGTDEFGDWDETRQLPADQALVNKRIRSLRHWRAGARAAGLEVTCLRRTRAHAMRTPENNVLMLRRRSGHAA